MTYLSPTLVRTNCPPRSFSGNIFPSAILSVATTDAEVIKPVEGLYVGNPKSVISIRLKTRRANSRVRVEVAETPFFSQSVSEFVLDKSGSTYTIYPDIIWKYEALRNNNQAGPVSVAIKVEINGANCGRGDEAGRILLRLLPIRDRTAYHGRNFTRGIRQI